eukprot:748639-Hanusia_phi.AAC.7
MGEGRGSRTWMNQNPASFIGSSPCLGKKEARRLSSGERSILRNRNPPSRTDHKTTEATRSSWVVEGGGRGR